MLGRGGLVSDAVPLEHGAFAPATLEIAAELERLVVYADAQERKVSQLQAALDSRVVVERAIGILAERFELSFPEAFELLRSAARNSRREVRAIGQELGTARETPPEIAELLPSSDDEQPEFLRCPRCGTDVSAS